jgi:alpha-mannosidase
MAAIMITRRDFLSASSAALLAPSAFAAPAKKILHIIGYSHIDAAWLWPWRDGSNTVLNTMRSALDRIAETPGFRYCHSSTAHYRWVQQSAPAMFAEIKSRIREGRWEVVGGWPVEPDCNIPSTESFVRHALYGKRFCQAALNTNVTIGFNPDSFGHAAGLPTILRHAGYDAYVFMRPREGEGDFPRLFQWEGPDGARVLTLHIWNGYSKDADAIPEAIKNVFAPGFDHGAFFLGVGDHGGAVTKAQIAKVIEMKRTYDADPALPELRWSTVREFLSAAAASPAYAQLPVIRGDLQHHARGCYSANGDEKYQNRRTERALFTSESIAALAQTPGAPFIAHSAMSGISALPYPRQEFAEAWRQLLFNQFHDILAGTTLFADYEQSRDDLGLANHVALAHKSTALESRAQQIDMSAIPEAAVLAYNPLPWPAARSSSTSPATTSLRSSPTSSPPTAPKSPPSNAPPPA